MLVLKNQIPLHAVDSALDHVRSHPREQLEWPARRWHPAILQLLSYLPAQRGLLCDPQIVVRTFADEKTHPSDGCTMHVDQVPEWAPSGSSYEAIIGVALTWQSHRNGAVVFSSLFSSLEGKCPESATVQPTLLAGDAVVFGGNEPHCTGIFEDALAPARVSVYFRFLDTNGAALPSRVSHW